MNAHALRMIALGLALFFAAGCSTPESRLQKNPEQYSRLSVDQQERALKGEIRAGDPVAVALLAQGKPSQKYKTKTPGGPVEVWVYTQQAPQTVPGPRPIRKTREPMRPSYTLTAMNPNRVRDVETLRLEVSDGVILSVKTPNR